MADCDLDIVYEAHVTEIKLYSNFKYASHNREPGITQDLYIKENQFEGSIVCFLG